ncbi:DUF932 domain-containing protein [Streptomyces globosus]|uniref:DUF932 domain-containing protein n=1 Tax=Streptomyces globosus TaxID=68209 RepID=UPI0031D7E139
MGVTRSLSWRRRTAAPSVSPCRSMSRVRKLFEQVDTQAGIRGTEWAGYNALTEYANHVAPARGATAELKSAARAERVITGTTDDVMERAFRLVAV